MELHSADPSMEDVYQFATPGPAGDGAGSHPEDAMSGRSQATIETEPLVVGRVQPPIEPASEASARENSAAEASPRAPASSKPKSAGGKLRPRRRVRARLPHLLQAWSFSLVVHAAILSALAFATFATSESAEKVLSFDSALASYRNGEQELTPIYADPDNSPRDKTVGDEHAETTGEPQMVTMTEGGGDGEDGGGVIVAGVGTGRPSATPRVRGAGRGRINEGTSLPGVKIASLTHSPMNLLPVAPTVDLAGGGKIAGDTIWDVKEIGAAMDQLAHEIVRHLREHKVTVVWLFDESVSMEDDKKSIKGKFDRVSNELKKYIAQDPRSKNAGVLNHAIVGFGMDLKYMLEKPRAEMEQIGQAIEKLPIDNTGIENTMHAVREVAEHYAQMVRRDRKVLIVLVTDESGDDGADVEEARQALKKHKIPLYVIGRQSLFGYPFAHHRYEDPVTHDIYHPLIRRGPETADLEVYQWDGLYRRWDEQPSGFAPYELARLTKESGGIYFLLPTEEFMRAIHHREKAYSSVALREYLPEHDNRMTYVEHREASPLRHTLHAIVNEGAAFLYRREFPIEHPELVQGAMEEGTRATPKLQELLKIQKRLESLKLARDREVDKRWQAHYDLMLAQTVAFQVKAYEYRALMASIVKNPPVPKPLRRADLKITWVVDHSTKPVAPHSETAKKYAEAERLLKDVIKKHPNTPWGDLAQDVLNRGLSVTLNEWHHNPKYHEREQFVPKY